MSQGAVPVFESGGGATSGPEGETSALIGTTLQDAYRVTRLIAEGGMSAVYEATQLRLNQRLAIKVMTRALASNPEALARFQREAEVTSSLRHPNLVTVMDFGTAPAGQPYLVMEYLEGVDLAHRLRDLETLPLPTATHITRQVASALAAAHGQGIVHRDLKPANIFLVALPGEPDFAKVLDFGISKVRAAGTQLTKASSIMGTPNYMSPEQASGMVDDIDHRTDQWALACMVWEMLAGRPPFLGDDISAVFYQVINLDPKPLHERAPDLPAGVEPVLRRALAKNIADRYPSILDFARALADAALPATPALTTPAPLSSGPPAAETAADITGIERRRAHRERRQTERSPELEATLADAASGEVVRPPRQGGKRILAVSLLAACLGAAAAALMPGLRPARTPAPAVLPPAPGPTALFPRTTPTLPTANTALAPAEPKTRTSTSTIEINGTDNTKDRIDAAAKSTRVRASGATRPAGVSQPNGAAAARDSSFLAPPHRPASHAKPVPTLDNSTDPFAPTSPPPRPVPRKAGQVDLDPFQP